MANNRSAAASVDTTLMDSEMKRTLGEETARKDRMSAIFAPFAKISEAMMKRMPKEFREMHAWRKARRKKIAALRAEAKP